MRNPKKVRAFRVRNQQEDNVPEHYKFEGIRKTNVLNMFVKMLMGS